MAYNEHIAKTILGSFGNQPKKDGEIRYGVSFYLKLQKEQDVIDTVDKLISDGKIIASINKQGNSIVVFDDRT